MFQSGLKIFGFTFSLLVLGFAAPAQAESKLDSSMSEDQKAVVNDMIHQFIMNNPEVLLESVELYQKRLEDEKVAKSERASSDLVADIKSSKVDVPFGGDLDAEFLIVEFLDYNCGFCKRGFEAIQGLVKEEDVKVAFIDLPVLGNSSREAAKYALAAKLQDKYFEYHVALFEKSGGKNEATYLKIGETLGLDTDKLKADANGDEVKAMLARNRELADTMGISGTPAFIIGTEFVPGFIPLEGMKSMMSSQK